MVPGDNLSLYWRQLQFNTGCSMARKSLPLSKVYGLLEPVPVVLLTTATRQRPNIMTIKSPRRLSMNAMQISSAG